MRYLALSAVLLLTAYGQLIIKARALVHAVPDEAHPASFRYLSAMFTDVGVWSGLGATLVAGVIYMSTLERMDIGLAYPFMALSFVLVPVGAAIMLGEVLSMTQAFGLGLIVLGVTVNTLAR